MCRASQNFNCDIPVLLRISLTIVNSIHLHDARLVWATIVAGEQELKHQVKHTGILTMAYSLDGCRAQHTQIIHSRFLLEN